MSLLLQALRALDSEFVYPNTKDPINVYDFGSGRWFPFRMCSEPD